MTHLLFDISSIIMKPFGFTFLPHFPAIVALPFSAQKALSGFQLACFEIRGLFYQGLNLITQTFQQVIDLQLQRFQIKEAQNSVSVFA